MRRLTPFFISISLLYITFVPLTYAGFTRNIEFPVDGNATFSDNFSDPRNGGRQHEGIDIIGEKMMPLISAVDGQVTFIANPEPSWGYAIYIKDDDGYEYSYLHINNDTPGTDDGNGGIENAYAPGISRGTRVTRGQFIGWMGDSGNAEGTSAHLHFEIHTPDGTPINPYESLLSATRKGAFDISILQEETATINNDKDISIQSDASCISGELIKSEESTAVYYCGRDGKRYVFPNDKVYFSWYDDFTEVVIVSKEELAKAVLGGNVTYKPGSKMIKIQTDPKVYVVDRGGTLRWVVSSDLAEQLYGVKWNKEIDDVSDAFFINYNIGEPITFVK